MQFELLKREPARDLVVKVNKNFDAADAIRDSLRNAGIALEDTSDGVRWNLEK